jgi:hypothetical protein
MTEPTTEELLTDCTVYKFLNGREAAYAPRFRYRLGAWKPAIEGQLVVCRNAYHGLRSQDLSQWIARGLFVIESRDEWLEYGNKLYTRGPVRIIEHLKGWNERAARLAAADFAEAVLPIFEKARPGDERPRRAIQAARDYANGEIGAAAWAAAGAAAGDAWDAAWDAAGAAAGAAAEAAAWAAAKDAAKDAAWAAQGQIILDYAYGRRS